jgi:putative ATP-dependent endonuclease of the OLD family
LASSELAEVVFYAVELAVVAKRKQARLTEVDEAAALDAAKAKWQSIGNSMSKNELAALIYEPLYLKDASKVVAAEYLGQLLRSKQYGTGDALLNKLPAYLKRALIHVTAGTAKSTPLTAKS